MQLDYQTIGKHIRHFRTQKNISQTSLSEMVNKSTTYISLVERGQKGPSLETLVDIANALQITLDTLLDEHLLNNTYALSGKVTSLIEDCSEKEKKILIENAYALKAILREAQRT